MDPVTDGALIAADAGAGTADVAAAGNAVIDADIDDVIAIADGTELAKNLKGAKDLRTGRRYNVPTKIEIPVWVPDFKKGENFAMLVFASRNSGKSYFVKYMIVNYLRRLFDEFIFVSDSPDETEEYANIIHGITLEEWDSRILQKLEARYKRRIADGLRPENVCIIFDDKIGYKIKNQDSILQIFTRGRHVGISIIFISQHTKFCENAWRSNADIVVCLKQNSSSNREKLMENIFMGTLDIDYRDEKDVYRDVIKKYMSESGDCLIVDNRIGSTKNLFRYRAGELKTPRYKKSKNYEDNQVLHEIQGLGSGDDGSDSGTSGEI